MRTENLPPGAYPIRCYRCWRPAPVHISELEGDSGGDPALLPVVVPPQGWVLPLDHDEDLIDFGEPTSPPDDDAAIVCPACATGGEVDAMRESLVQIDSLLRQDPEDAG